MSVQIPANTTRVDSAAQVDEMPQPFDQSPWFGAIIGSISTAVTGKIFRLLRAPDRDDLARVVKLAKAEVAAVKVETANSLVALEGRFKETVKELKEDGEARTARIEQQIAIGFSGINGRIDGIVDKRRSR